MGAREGGSGGRSHSRTGSKIRSQGPSLHSAHHDLSPRSGPTRRDRARVPEPDQCVPMCVYVSISAFSSMAEALDLSSLLQGSPSSSSCPS